MSVNICCFSCSFSDCFLIVSLVFFHDFFTCVISFLNCFSLSQGSIGTIFLPPKGVLLFCVYRMPRYYCDYCDTYLTHDSPSVRKQHNAGYKHKGNVRTYYQQFEAQLNQSLIDQKVKEHLGAFRPVGLPFPQLRPGLPGLPTPQMQMPGNPQMPAGAQWVPGMRPPVLPRPMPGLPGYAPPPMPQMLAPPGAPMPGQVNNMQRPVGPPSAVPGSMGMPAPTGGPPMFAPPPVYQGSTTVPTNGGGDSSSINAQAADSNQ